MLYLCTLVATRQNPVLRAFLSSPACGQQEPKITLIACMRKLLIMLNAVLRQQTMWNPELGASDRSSPFSTARGGAVITANVVGTA